MKKYIYLVAGPPGTCLYTNQFQANQDDESPEEVYHHHNVYESILLGQKERKKRKSE
jgi:hypothetical protein